MLLPSFDDNAIGWSGSSHVSYLGLFEEKLVSNVKRHARSICFARQLVLFYVILYNSSSNSSNNAHYFTWIKCAGISDKSGWRRWCRGSLSCVLNLTVKWMAVYCSRLLCENCKCCLISCRMPNNMFYTILTNNRRQPPHNHCQSTQVHIVSFTLSHPMAALYWDPRLENDWASVFVRR